MALTEISDRAWHFHSFQKSQNILEKYISAVVLPFIYIRENLNVKCDLKRTYKKEDNRDSLNLSHFKENRTTLFWSQGENNGLTTEHCQRRSAAGWLYHRAGGVTRRGCRQMVELEYPGQCQPVAHTLWNQPGKNVVKPVWPGSA